MCAEQQNLLNEESRAWSAYEQLRDSGCENKQEMTRRADDASLVSSRLREHIRQCHKCQDRLVGYKTLMAYAGD